jgi:hypothetical protein
MLEKKWRVCLCLRLILRNEKTQILNSKAKLLFVSYNYFLAVSPPQLLSATIVRASNQFQNLDYPPTVARNHHIAVLAPTHGRHKVVGVRAPLNFDQTVSGRSAGLQIKRQIEQLLRQALVVHAQRVVLAAARQIVAVRCQPDKVLFVCVAGERTMTIRWRIDVPQFERAIGAGRHDLLGVEKLNVGHGLFVTLEHAQRLLHVPQVVVVHTVVGRTERQMAGTARIELDTAHVGLGLECVHRMVARQAPQLDAPIVRSTGQQFRVDLVEVDAPTPFVVLLKHLGAHAPIHVPYLNDALVVAGGEHILKVTVPDDAGYFAAAHHLVDRVLDVDDGVTDGGVIVEDLNALGDAGDGEEFTVLVELNARHDGRGERQVVGVVERGQWPEGAVLGELGQTLAKDFQAVVGHRFWLRVNSHIAVSVLRYRRRRRYRRLLAKVEIGAARRKVTLNEVIKVSVHPLL